MVTLQTFEHAPHLAELKLSYRRRRAKQHPSGPKAPVLSSPVNCENYIRNIWDKDTITLREEFIVVCLNAALGVLGWVKIASGGMSTVSVDAKLVFGVALQTASSGIILAHNHPSGNLTPSPQDIEFTRRMRAAGKLLDVRVVDHVIISSTGCYSLAENESW